MIKSTSISHLHENEGFTTQPPMGMAHKPPIAEFKLQRPKDIKTIGGWSERTAGGGTHKGTTFGAIFISKPGYINQMMKRDVSTQWAYELKNYLHATMNAMVVRKWTLQTFSYMWDMPLSQMLSRLQNNGFLPKSKHDNILCQVVGLTEKGISMTESFNLVLSDDRTTITRISLSHQCGLLH